MKISHLFLASTFLAYCFSSALAEDIPPLTADEMAFSVSNMDPSVDPRKDFYRYAAGHWLKTAERPKQLSHIGPFDYMAMHLNKQMKNVLEKAAAEAPAAKKGTPVQQVGDFYAGYMDEEQLRKNGIKALQPELDRIAAINSLKDFAHYVGRYALVTGDPLFIGLGPGQDRADNSKMVVYMAGTKLNEAAPRIYEGDDHSTIRELYRDYIRQMMVIAGYTNERAKNIAETVIAIETALYKGKLSPVEAANPLNNYHPMETAKFQAVVPDFDIKAYAEGATLPLQGTLVVSEPRYAEAANAVLKTHSIDDLKDFLAWTLISTTAGLVSPDFQTASRKINEALSGTGEIAPRNERALATLQLNMGHPVSKVYVDNYFTGETRAKATDMMARIKTAFRNRMQGVAWLTPPTKAAALDKLDKLTFAVGYPDEWIDYSGVDIRRDDMVGNFLRLQEFANGRDMAKIGKPLKRDGFASPKHTLPIVINAAYDLQLNGFEVPAAILQPPVFEPKLDAPVYFCKLGAVIGHEMTHGFDSAGRRFDAKGNMNDWWTPEDTAAFEKEAAKLVEQASNYEILPGLHLNGQLTVTENMADAAGIAIAYDALKSYLAEHPDENVPREGLTPDQRCFVAFAQMWASKTTEETIRIAVATDVHAPNEYRTTAPLQHLDAFYSAFGIKEGDPMWLPPEKRLKAW